MTLSSPVTFRDSRADPRVVSYELLQHLTFLPEPRQPPNRHAALGSKSTFLGLLQRGSDFAPSLPRLGCHSAGRDAKIAQVPAPEQLRFRVESGNLTWPSAGESTGRKGLCHCEGSCSGQRSSGLLVTFATAPALPLCLPDSTVMTEGDWESLHAAGAGAVRNVPRSEGSHEPLCEHKRAAAPSGAPPQPCQVQGCRPLRVEMQGKARWLL